MRVNEQETRTEVPIRINYVQVLCILALTMYCHGMEICNEAPTSADCTVEKARTLEFFVTQLDVEMDKKIAVEAPKLENATK